MTTMVWLDEENKIAYTDYDRNDSRVESRAQDVPSGTTPGDKLYIVSVVYEWYDSESREGPYSKVIAMTVDVVAVAKLKIALNELLFGRKRYDNDKDHTVESKIEFEGYMINYGEFLGWGTSAKELKLEVYNVV